jgi:hypothetical protein
MEEVEKQTFIMLQDIAYDRFLLELASGEEVIEIIEQCIRQARPLSSMWLVTPDAIPVVDPETAWSRYSQLLSADDLAIYSKFGGIDLSSNANHYPGGVMMKPDRLHISRSEDHLDFSPFVYDERTHSLKNLVDPNQVVLTGSNNSSFSGRARTAPAQLGNKRSGNNLYSNPSLNDLGEIVEETGEEASRFQSFYGRSTDSMDTTGTADGGKSKKARTPRIRNQDDMTNYNYLKKLLPKNSSLRQIQKENYLASQGSSSQTSINRLTSGGKDTAPNGVNAKSTSSLPSVGNTGGKNSRSTSAQNTNANNSRRPSTRGSSGNKKDSRRASSAQKDHNKDHNKDHKDNHHGNSHSHSSSHTSLHSHDRPHSPVVIDPKEMEKYHHDRQALEEKLMIRRELREKEFLSMGMSVPNAKLAAYNDCLLEEQHEWSDFDNHHRRVLAHLHESNHAGSHHQH